MGDNPQLESRAAKFESLLADVFQRAGWEVQRGARAGNREIDLLIARPPYQYAVEMKVASEARRDRVLPLLSQAILQAQAAARYESELSAPLAVIAASHIPESLLPAIREFAHNYAPDVAVGLFDLEGLCSFSGPGLESLNAPHVRLVKRGIVPMRASASQLFSDLNQWMLKVLLAPRIPEPLLSAPRLEYQNASQLAEASNVSVMSAFRFVRQLQEEHFLNAESHRLHLVRIDELMRRWQAASLRSLKDLPMRWILRRDPEQQLRDAVRAYQKSAEDPQKSERVASPPPRICLGLFAAADALGAGFVHGAPAHLYIEKAHQQAIESLGLVPAEAANRVDVFLRIPPAREAVFRAAVSRDGMPVSDILQVWLDVAAHPSRGKEQAEQIKRRFLLPVFNGKS
jgi:Restriction endonuclease